MYLLYHISYIMNPSWIHKSQRIVVFEVFNSQAVARFNFIGRVDLSRVCVLEICYGKVPEERKYSSLRRTAVWIFNMSLD